MYMEFRKDANEQLKSQYAHKLMCIDAIIKDCYKVILHKLELLKVQLEEQSFKTGGSLDLNETSKEPTLTQYIRT